ELHDVALVHQRHTRQLLVDGVLDGHAYEALAALGADRLDADAARGDDVVAHLLEERDELPGLVGVALELDAAVDVLGVLAEDDHVDAPGPLVGGLDALEVAHRADAGVEIEADAQVDVDGPEAAADGRRQRALQADAVVLEGLEGVVGQVEAALVALAER